MNIDITVFCLTYNHAAYIRDALESFLMQKTSYTYNVFVYDDASTDGTSDILREYKKKYPEIFDIYIYRHVIYIIPQSAKKSWISYIRSISLEDMLPGARETIIGLIPTNCKNRSSLWSKIPSAV